MATVLRDRTLLRIAGSRVLDFLQGLVTADVRLLADGQQPIIPAAFLSPKGRLLADCLLHRDGDEGVLVDVHSDVSASLLRLLRRQRLRLPLQMEQERSRAVVASPASLEGLHEDPRYVGLGYRGVLAAPADTESDADASWYVRRRVLCGIPEGPQDFGVDATFPLHGNLDLFGAVSFAKGCYVGQELTTRSKMRGAVRRRFVVVAAGRPIDEADTSGNDLERSSAGADECQLPEVGDEEVQAKQDNGKEPESQMVAAGTLKSVSGRFGLCSVKLPSAANNAEAFAAVFRDLPSLYLRGMQLYPTLPPYVSPSPPP